MQIRDRVEEFRRVRAGDLRPHPLNWRSHPPAQQNGLRGVLAEIGFAGALLARELADGGLQLIDGHLRAETLPEALLPVLILDVDEREAAALLALVDPLAGMATTDGEKLKSLLAEVECENPALQEILDLLNEDASSHLCDNAASPEVSIDDAFQVVVECADESTQREVYERLTSEGFQCRLLTL